jgi:hypothetical protein
MDCAAVVKVMTAHRDQRDRADCKASCEILSSERQALRRFYM